MVKLTHLKSQWIVQWFFSHVNVCSCALLWFHSSLVQLAWTVRLTGWITEQMGSLNLGGPNKRTGSGSSWARLHHGPPVVKPLVAAQKTTKRPY